MPHRFATWGLGYLELKLGPRGRRGSVASGGPSTSLLGSLLDLRDGAGVDEAAVLQFVPDVVASFHRLAAHLSCDGLLLPGVEGSQQVALGGGRRSAVGAVSDGYLEGRDGGDLNAAAAVITAIAYRREGARFQDDRLRRLRPGGSRSNGARVGQAAGRPLAFVFAAAGGEDRNGKGQCEQRQRKGAYGHGRRAHSTAAAAQGQARGA